MNMKSEGPESAVAGAIRAKIETAYEGFLSHQHSALCPKNSTVFVWHPEAHSVERLRTIGEES